MAAENGVDVGPWPFVIRHPSSMPPRRLSTREGRVDEEMPMSGLLRPAAALAADQPPRPPSPAERPRLIVLTDISSLQARVAEPDDGQSMIRLMLYANDLD